MAGLPGKEKAALLLSRLPALTAERLLAQLGPQHSSRLRAEMARLADHPEVESLLEQVLRDFESALKNPGRQSGTDIVPARSDKPPTPPPPPIPTPKLDHTKGPVANDPVGKLRLLPHDRLALGLAGEHPRVIALVLHSLDTTEAGEVLKRLPPELRKLVSVQLGINPAAGVEHLPRIAIALISKCESLKVQGPEASEDIRFKRMADMLRLLEKPDRLDLLAVLEQHDAATATAVKDYLYQFEDLLLIEDRSVQKILAEIEAKVLATALKDAEKAIADKVLANLSKRARESIMEEMELLRSTTGPQIQQARKAVVDVIQRLDQAGELTIGQ